MQEEGDSKQNAVLQQTLEQIIRHERELNAMKTRFISMVSHELRSPLASIMMSTENMRSNWNRMSSQQIDSKLGTIQHQITQMIAILSDVMQSARMQEGRMDPLLEKVDIVALCQSVIESFMVDDKLIGKLALESSTEQLIILADRQLIRQTIYNLLSNAVKYSQPNPEVCLQLTNNHQHVILKIIDNGIGIPHEDLPRLYEPFFRASNSRNVEGNGLGLNIVRETILLHNGDIQVTSTLKKGTTFIVTLPLKTNKNQDEHQ